MAVCRTCWLAPNRLTLRPNVVTCPGVNLRGHLVTVGKKTSRTIFFVNPWGGVIGPNVGMEQLASECVRRGHRVVMVIGTPAPGDEPLERMRAMGVQPLIVGGDELIRRPRNPLALVRYLWRSWRAASRAGRLCRREAADVICLNSENLLFMPRIGPACGRKSVTIIRGTTIGKNARVGRAFVNIQKRWVWKYVAVSRMVKNMIVGLGASPDQVEVICNGVDVHKYQPGPARPGLREELGIPADAPVFGDVSVVRAHKGSLHLVDVLYHVRQSLPNARCLVIGDTLREDGPACTSQLRARAEELGISDGLIFVGERPDVPELLRVMDVMVHPSHTESFGRVIAEAMAAARPVVGFAIDAIGEVIDAGRTGYVVPAFDVAAMAQATVTLLKDEPLRRQMGQAGRAKVLQQYDQARNVSAIVDLLEAACEPSVQGQSLLVCP